MREKERGEIGKGKGDIIINTYTMSTNEKWNQIYNENGLKNLSDGECEKK